MNHSFIRLKRIVYQYFSFFANRWPVILSLVLISGLLFLFQATKSYLGIVGLNFNKSLTFFDNPQNHLQSTNDRTNFLLLGIRGFGDQGEDLTDTMLLISYSHLSKQISLLSIPRDLWITSLQTKVNSVYHYGKFKEDGGGIKLVSSAVLESLGLPVHYVAVVDFNFFKSVINSIGGINVNVQRQFTDDKFPLPGKETSLPLSTRYETISFDKGFNHFDGETALKFVRSRNAQGDEGTDTARNQRQQLVIESLKQKILDKEILFDPKKLEELYRIFTNTVDTNIPSDIYPPLARLVLDSRSRPINEIEVSTDKDRNGLVVLENPKPSYLYQNQWVLIAKDNNWKALKQYLQNRLDGKQ